MAYDEGLADRIRACLAAEPDVVEMRAFGGLAFMVAGHLACSASGQGGLLLRVDPGDTDNLLDAPRVSRFVMRGREMNGWLLLGADAVAGDDDLRSWLERGVAYIRTLPPKA